MPPRRKYFGYRLTATAEYLRPRQLVHVIRHTQKMNYRVEHVLKMVSVTGGRPRNYVRADHYEGDMSTATRRLSWRTGIVAGTSAGLTFYSPLVKT